MTTDEVKRRGAGRYHEVVAALLGPEYTDGRHHDCPVHDGEGAQFRWDRRREGWFCYSESGDAFDLIQRLESCTFPEAVQRAAEILGLEPNGNGRHHRARVATPKHKPVVAPPPATKEKPKAKGWDACKATWDASHPLDHPEAAPGRAYLKARGLKVPDPPPAALRCHPALPYYEDGQEVGRFPALVALVKDAMGEPCAVQRIYLAEDGSGKAPLPDGLPAKKSLGDLQGGSVRLDEARPGEPLAIAEGPETAEAVREATGLPTWATVSAAGMAAVVIAKEVGVVYVAADLDRSKAGEDNAEKLAARLHGEGRTVKVVFPPGGPLREEEGKSRDFLDVLNQDGAEAIHHAFAEAKEWEPPEEIAWPTPPKLGADATPPTPFPVDALPPAMRQIVTETAASIQVPPDLPGSLALPALALAVGHRAEISLGGGHVEPGNLYNAVAQPPGARKSATFKVITRPINEREAELREQYEDDHENWQARAFIAKAKLKKLEQEAKKSAGSNLEAEVREQQCILDSEPKKPTLVTSNCTTEAMVDLMAKGDGVLGAFSAEGAQLFAGIGQYKKGANTDLDALLEAHAGDPIRNHRVLRGESYVRHPCLTIGITIQPSVIQTVGANREFCDRGLVARFLWSHPADLVGHRRYSDDIPAISEGARQGWKMLLEGVFDMEPDTTDGDPRPWRVTVDRDALEVWRTFAQDVEDRQAEGGDLLHVRDFASKLAGSVARIALGFHLADGIPSEQVQRRVTRATMERAIRLGRYFLAHFLRVFRFMAEDGRTATAARVLDWLREKARKGKPLSILTARDLQRDNVAGIIRATQAQEVLDFLAGEDWIRKIPPKPKATGRHPNPRFSVHPSVNRPTKPTKGQDQGEGEGVLSVLSGGFRGERSKTPQANSAEEPPLLANDGFIPPEKVGAAGADEDPPPPFEDAYLAAVAADSEPDGDLSKEVDL